MSTNSNSSDETNVIRGLVALVALLGGILAWQLLSPIYSPADTPPIPVGEWIYMGQHHPMKDGRETALVARKGTIKTGVYTMEACQEMLSLNRAWLESRAQRRLNFYLIVDADQSCTGARGQQ